MDIHKLLTTKLTASIDDAERDDEGCQSAQSE